MDNHLLPTLLQTKLAVPSAPPAFVPRRRLLSRLQEASQREAIRLTLVSAPAGFGKTTLLSDWARESGTHVGWLTLEESDNDLAQFLGHLVAAVRRACPRVDAEILKQFHTPRKAATAQLLASLINDLANSDCRQLSLILDDYHLINAQEIHDAVTFLIDHLPASMHLVIATRADPPLPIARLRGRQQLIEIRRADLSFTTDEARSFFATAMALELPERDIDLLNARTEGWAAGLQMAALALRGAHRQQKDLHQMVASFGGSHRYVLDYLSDEVLQSQPPPLQTFLLKTSVLERLCASLCNAVTGQNDGREQLQKLDGANLFIVPLDEERRWYRYHRLFADLLQARLHQTYPDEVNTLHLRAATWYEAHDDLASAIHHLLAAEALAPAADLIQRAAPSTLRRSEVGRFLKWIGQLPEGMVRDRPTLLFYTAWAKLLSGAAWHEVGKILSGFDIEGEPWRSRAILLSAFDILFHGQFTRSEALARRALEHLPSDDLFWRDIASWILSLALAYPVNSQPVEGRLTRTAQLAQKSGDTLVAVNSLCGLAALRRRQGSLRQAKATYEQALTLARDDQGALLPVAGQALIGLGNIALEWNELERAAGQLEKGIGLVSRWREIAAMRGYVPLSWVHHLQGDSVAAYRLLDYVAQLAELSDSIEWDDHYVAMSRARLDIACGNLRAAHQWVRAREVTAPFRADSRDMNDRLRKYEHLVLARLLLKDEQADEALRFLDPVLDFARRQERIHLLIEGQILRALSFEVAGKEGPALQALGQALKCARPGGYVRAFLDEGAPVARLLDKAARADLMPDYTQELLSWMDEPEASETVDEDGDQPLVEPLSERELEVLDLVARGLTNKEIAQHLYISVTTVKWHTSNIYGKLGVANRMQAAAKARALGILPSPS